MSPCWEGYQGGKRPGWGLDGLGWSPESAGGFCVVVNRFAALPNSISQLQIWDHVTKSRNNTAAVTIVDAAHETPGPHPATEQGDSISPGFIITVANRRPEKSRSLA